MSSVCVHLGGLKSKFQSTNIRGTAGTDLLVVPHTANAAPRDGERERQVSTLDWELTAAKSSTMSRLTPPQPLHAIFYSSTRRVFEVRARGDEMLHDIGVLLAHGNRERSVPV